MNNLGKRKSIRKYSGKAVSEALLTSLLQQAERTPTMGNLQLYSVVVTRDDAMKRQLAPAHFSQPMVTGAPVVLTFCADFRRTSLWAKNRNAVPGYDNLLSLSMRPPTPYYIARPSVISQKRLDWALASWALRCISQCPSSNC